jgi:hypothetical protein
MHPGQVVQLGRLLRQITKSSGGLRAKGEHLAPVRGMRPPVGEPVHRLRAIQDQGVLPADRRGPQRTHPVVHVRAQPQLGILRGGHDGEVWVGPGGRAEAGLEPPPGHRGHPEQPRRHPPSQCLMLGQGLLSKPLTGEPADQIMESIPARGAVL